MIILAGLVGLFIPSQERTRRTQQAAAAEPPRTLNVYKTHDCAITPELVEKFAQLERRSLEGMRGQGVPADFDATPSSSRAGRRGGEARRRSRVPRPLRRCCFSPKRSTSLATNRNRSGRAGDPELRMSPRRHLIAEPGVVFNPTSAAPTRYTNCDSLTCLARLRAGSPGRMARSSRCPRDLLATASLGRSVAAVVLPRRQRRLSRSEIDFNRDVRPILSNNCFQCHGPDEKVRKAKLRLDTRDGALGRRRAR